MEKPVQPFERYMSCTHCLQAEQQLDVAVALGVIPDAGECPALPGSQTAALADCPAY